MHILVLWKLMKNVLSSLTVNYIFKFFRNVLFLVINSPTEPSSYSYEWSSVLAHRIQHVAGTVHLSQIKIMAMMMIRIKVSTTDTNQSLLFSIFTMFCLCERWKQKCLHIGFSTPKPAVFNILTNVLFPQTFILL